MFEPAPENTYPVLQVHLTALFEFSCEQSALVSQPPLFVWQLSANREKRIVFEDARHTQLGCFLPVQVTFGATPVLVYPVLQLHTIALLVESCEQIELESHPPFFTWQLSRKQGWSAFSRLQSAGKYA